MWKDPNPNKCIWHSCKQRPLDTNIYSYTPIYTVPAPRGYIIEKCENKQPFGDPLIYWISPPLAVVAHGQVSHHYLRVSVASISQLDASGTPPRTTCVHQTVREAAKWIPTRKLYRQSWNSLSGLLIITVVAWKVSSSAPSTSSVDPWV